MNTKRVDFSSYPLSPICINPYWLLGFVEGDGHFSLSSLSFGVTQHAKSIALLEAIRLFFINEASLMNINLLSHISVNANSNVAQLSITNLSC